MNGIPDEIKEYFSVVSHPFYPLLEIPQRFEDKRGEILNIADGTFGDVAIIESKKNSIRANHFHKQDWHLTFILQGAAIYSHRDVNSSMGETWQDLEVDSHSLLITPSKTWHRFQFTENTLMVVISGLSRKKVLYDADTVKVD